MRSYLGKRAAQSLIVAAAGLAVLLASGAAASSTNTISVSGPTKNLYHTYFNETVSGYAVLPANFVVSGEQLYPAGGCASTYLAERHKRGFFLWGTSASRPGGTRPVHGSFSTVARFWARNHSEHGICSYLINRGTMRTYAHASLWWNNS